jgi:hypothetical protein
MKTPQPTPYGHFESQIAAARFIYENGHAAAFNETYPEPRWKRHDWGGRYEAQNLLVEVQDICDVIRQLRRERVPGWFPEAVQPVPV